MLVSYCACVGLIAVYWAIVARYNRRLDGLDPETGASSEDLTEAFADQTDFQQRNFRYTT